MICTFSLYSKKTKKKFEEENIFKIIQLVIKLRLKVFSLKKFVIKVITIITKSRYFVYK